jgi:hypothetical protein
LERDDALEIDLWMAALLSDDLETTVGYRGDDVRSKCVDQGVNVSALEDRADKQHHRRPGWTTWAAVRGSLAHPEQDHPNLGPWDTKVAQDLIA